MKGRQGRGGWDGRTLRLHRVGTARAETKRGLEQLRPATPRQDCALLCAVSPPVNSLDHHFSPKEEGSSRLTQSGGRLWIPAISWAQLCNLKQGHFIICPVWRQSHQGQCTWERGPGLRALQVSDSGLGFWCSHKLRVTLTLVNRTSS